MRTIPNSPKMHWARELLRRLAGGEETVAPWNEAKERIRAQIKSH
ncbi:MAG: hypothetical protein Q8O52_24710 [Sulfuritalea sp.]|nr:hypothetical protein [Sulfuritalea sp.]